MLEQRIVDTLKFFSLQGMPLTFLELQKFLIVNLGKLQENLDAEKELTQPLLPERAVKFDVLLVTLKRLVGQGVVVEYLGYFALAGDAASIEQRWTSYQFGIQRERLVRRFAPGLRFIPFVRGVALAGSQALGLAKKDSDIDLFIITDNKFLWTARTLVTAYFQVFGVRRHGEFVRNRFCLNHYVAGAKLLTEGRNLYTAFEYAKLRPIVHPWAIAQFQARNRTWIQTFFPNWKGLVRVPNHQSFITGFVEALYARILGTFFERELKKQQVDRIHADRFILVTDDELSFHPNSKQEQLLGNFFEFQKQDNREPEQLVA